MFWIDALSAGGGPTTDSCWFTAAARAFDAVTSAARSTAATTRKHYGRAVRADGWCDRVDPV